jgi:hypothetical protein
VLRPKREIAAVGPAARNAALKRQNQVFGQLAAGHGIGRKKQPSGSADDRIADYDG